MIAVTPCARFFATEEYSGWRGFVSLLVLMMNGVLANTSFARQAPPLDPVLQHALANRKQTAGEAQKYTYSEHYRSLKTDSSGATEVKFTDTFEIFFLNGAPYKKHVLHNEKPLPEKEQKAEDEKLADVAKARLDQQKAKRMFHSTFTFEFPLDQLSTRFTVISDGIEDLDGRRDLVFTATPKLLDPVALHDAARDGVAYQMKLWVDQDDAVFSKMEGQVVADGMRYEKGTLVTYQFRKVNQEAWLPVRFWFKGKIRYMMSDVPAEAEQTYSNYKKFSVDTKLFPE